LSRKRSRSFFRVVSAFGIVQKRNWDKSVAVRTGRRDNVRGSWVDKEGDISGVGVQIVKMYEYANLW